MKSAILLLMSAKGSFIGISTFEVSHLSILLIFFTVCPSIPSYYINYLYTIRVLHMNALPSFSQHAHSLYCAQAQVCTVKTVLLTTSFLKQCPFPDSFVSTCNPAAIFLATEWVAEFRPRYSWTSSRRSLFQQCLSLNSATQPVANKLAAGLQVLSKLS